MRRSDKKNNHYELINNEGGNTHAHTHTHKNNKKNNNNIKTFQKENNNANTQLIRKRIINKNLGLIIGREFPF